LDDILQGEKGTMEESRKCLMKPEEEFVGMRPAPDGTGLGQRTKQEVRGVRNCAPLGERQRY